MVDGWSEDWNFDTRAIRAGQVRTAEQEHSEALFPTSSFVFDSAAQAAARFAHEQPGNVYSRFTNPTVRTFEQRLAALEGGERGLATASGMAAITATCMSLLNAGDHILASYSLFGTTVVLFEKILSRFGIETTFVPQSDYAAWERGVRGNTRLLFLETPSNPLTEIADITRLAEIAHSGGALLVVDNCFCTPALQQPLALGADLIIHSATKYLDGQGRCVGGAVIGADALIEEKIYPFLRTAGPSMSPFNAWVFLKGLETLRLRMQAHCRNALGVATWLEDHHGVERVYYPGLPNHPQHLLAARQQRGHGGIVSFEVAGGREAAWRVIDGVKFLSITANLGDTKTTIVHPATTTHGRLTPEDRERMGIREGLIRLSVGLEDLDDLRTDLERALARL
jgi:O-succinylhomoserine sulfhydrylase